MNREINIAPELLGPAIRATREALRRLDDDAVPHPLRRVAASSARRLPPPLLEVLVAFLDDAEWLRTSALDSWPEADVDDVDPRVAGSALFLARPDGWELRLAALTDERGGADTGRVLEARDREIRRLEGLVDELTARLETQKAQADTERAEAKERVASAAGRREAVYRALEQRRLELEDLSTRTMARLDAAERDLIEADARIDELRARITRRERSSDPAAARGFGRGSPFEVARDLDQLADALRSGSDLTSASTPPQPLVLPPGVRPDDPAAIDWLLKVMWPVRVLVDGYNVAHEVASPPDGETRRRVEDVLVRLRRLSAAPLHVVVFWDSAEGRGQRAERGLDVRFVPDADDAITAEAGADGRPTVVITGDRHLRERAQRQSLVPIWSSALVEWMSPPR